MLEKLEKAYEQIRTAAVPQLPLEMMVIGDQTTSVKPQVLTNTTPELRSSPPTVGGESPSDAREGVVSEHKGKYKLEDVKEKWADILKDVKPKNHSVEALLRSTSPMDFDGQDLLLEVFYKFHKDKLETEKCRQLVEQSVQTVFGISTVHLKLKLGVKTKSDDISESVVADDIVKAAEKIFQVDAV
jgi:hypothetical protein